MATSKSIRETIANGTDEDLMLRVKTGDDWRLASVLYLRYVPAKNYIARQGVADHAVDDIYQETWKSIWKARSSYEPRSKFKTYFFTVLKNKIIDHLRKEGRDPTIIDFPPEFGQRDDPVGGHQAEVRECIRHYLKSLTKLTLPQRQAVQWRCSEGLGLSQIAELQGVGLETARSRLRYGLNEVRKSLPPGCYAIAQEEDLLDQVLPEDVARKHPKVLYDSIERPSPPRPPAIPYNPFHPITREEIGEPYSESEWELIYRFIHKISSDEPAYFGSSDEMTRAIQEAFSWQPPKLSFLKRLINRLLRRS